MSLNQAVDTDVLDALHWCCLGSVYPADPGAFERARTLGLLDAHPWMPTAAGELELARRRPDIYGQRRMAVACPKCKAQPYELCTGRLAHGEITHVSRGRQA